jgi:hypothetical protein
MIDTASRPQPALTSTGRLWRPKKVRTTITTQPTRKYHATGISTTSTTATLYLASTASRGDMNTTTLLLGLGEAGQHQADRLIRAPFSRTRDSEPCPAGLSQLWRRLRPKADIVDPGVGMMLMDNLQRRLLAGGMLCRRWLLR